MGLRVNVINRRKISEPQTTQLDDHLNYKEMISYLGYFNLIKKLDLVLAPSSEMPLFIGNCEFLNINYLFNYLLDRTSMSVKLNESIFAGGKGFHMYKAVCSSLGEAFERLMACLEFFYIKDQFIIGSYRSLKEEGHPVLEPSKFQMFAEEQFESEHFLFDKFEEDTIVSWMRMKELGTDKDVYVPACLISMYYKPVDPREKRIGFATSGGLTSHYTNDRGARHGLMEIIERHEINLSWYCKIPPKEIVLDDVKNKQLLKYKEYIQEKNIKFYRHNVDQQHFHVITAMSFDNDLTKYSFNAGGGIHSDIEQALIAALEEYTQAVNNTRKIVYAPNWLTSKFSNGVLDVQEGDDPKKFKTFYQAVSYYGLKCYQNRLDWYVKDNERVLLSEVRANQEDMSILQYIEKQGLSPTYVHLHVSELFNHIYITKVNMPEFSPAFIAGSPALGHPSYKKFLREGEAFNKEILPFP